MMELQDVRRRPGRPTNAELAARVVTPENMPTAAIVSPSHRWQLADLDAWLLGRLQDRWGGDERYWRGKLAGYAAANEFLFITNDDGVVLAEQRRHPMSGVPVVYEIFAFARGDEASALRLLRPLYRQMQEWAKAMSATRWYVGICSDVLPSTLKDMLGKDAYYLAAGPC